MVARVLKCCKLLLTYLEQPHGAGTATATDFQQRPGRGQTGMEGHYGQVRAGPTAMQKVLPSEQDLKKKGKSNTKTPPLFDSTHTHANTT